jgi:hypothetical protein
MIKIGITGAESNHSEFFAGLLNDKQIPDV